MKRPLLLPMLFALSIASTMVLDTCSGRVDEDAAVSQAPPEYVEAFRRLDSLDKAHPQGGLLLILTQSAYDAGYQDAVRACQEHASALCTGEESPHLSRLEVQQP